MEALQLLPQAPRELVETVQAIAAPGALADFVAAYIEIGANDRQELLETIDLAARIDKVTKLLSERLEVLRLTHEIGQQTRATFDKRQREAVLREQMAAIQRQLGEGDTRAGEVQELNEKLARAGMPTEVEELARREVRRYEQMPEGATEAGMVRAYLDWLARLALGAPGGKADRYRQGAQHARRRSFRPRENQAAHRRISRGSQAGAQRQGADSLFRRPSRRRQDIARSIDRARHGPRLRTRQPGRRA